MKNIFLTIALVFIQHIAFAQKTIEPTDSFTIYGLVEKSVTITLADLQKEKKIDIGNFKITNHKGEFRKEYKNIKGVRLLDIVKRVNLLTPDVKLLSEFYLVAKASDGYSVVISWNELFNSEIGNSFILVVEADNKPQNKAQERILLIAIKDLATGRRHVKGLKSIEVKRI